MDIPNRNASSWHLCRHAPQHQPFHAADGSVLCCHGPPFLSLIPAKDSVHIKPDPFQGRRSTLPSICEHQTNQIAGAK